MTDFKWLPYFKCSIALLMSITCVIGGYSKAGDNPVAIQLTTAEGYLSSVGGKLEFYITKEFPRQGGLPSEVPPQVSAFWINRYRENSSDIASVDELVVHLRKTLVDITVVRNRCNPKVIHLIDNAALNEKQYPMDQRIVFCFKGVLSEVPDAIRKCVPRISSWHSGDNTRTDSDWVSQVQCRICQPQTVRDILTNAVPQPYSKRPAGRVLWESLYQGTVKDGAFFVRFPYPALEDDPYTSIDESKPIK